MAITKHPLFSTEASGNMAGVEYRRGTYGNVVGRTSLAPGRQSQLQLERQKGMRAAHTAWRALSDADRRAWSVHATPPNSGFNEYFASWSRLNMLGELGPITAKPTYQGYLWENCEFAWDSPPGSRLIPFPWEQSQTGVWVACYVLATYSHRTHPTPSKLRFYSKCEPGFGPWEIDLGVRYPVWHLRYDQIDPASGRVVNSYSYRVEPEW